MKTMLMLMTLFISLTSLTSLTSYASNCSVEDFVKSTEGQDKLNLLVDQSKNLIISKFEDLGIDEQLIEVKTVYPKTAEDLRTSLKVLVKSKNLNVEGTSFTIRKSIHEEDCGIEISINNGEILNKESGKNFGSLGRIKEFVRLN